MSNSTTDKSSQLKNIKKTIKNLESSIPANSNLEISNQLVNKIIEKDKKIDELGSELNLIYEMFGDDIKQKIKGKITIIDDTINNNSGDNKNLINTDTMNIKNLINN